MLTSDLRFAVRSLLRKPAFTSIVVATLALCIGATTAVFSIVESVLRERSALSPVGPARRRVVEQPEGEERPLSGIGGRLLRLAAAEPLVQPARRLLSHLEFAVQHARRPRTNRRRRSLGKFSPNARRLAADRSWLHRRRGQTAAPPEPVILTHAFWSRDFQSDAAIIGKTLTLDDRPFVVIGVMDERFTFPQSRVDVLMPLSVLGSYLDRREVHMLSVIGRLRDGVSLDAARREMTPISAQLEQEHPKEDGGLGITVMPVSDDLLGDVRRPILVLFGAVCAVLLIGCANVTNLMFGRAWSRRQELAVRTAMGAQPGAIVQQLLIESGVIAAVSGALGIGIALVATRTLANLLPAPISRIGQIHIDAAVLTFTLAVSIVVTIVCGTAPALEAARTTMRRAIGDAARVSHSRGGRRVYRALIVGELALALVLAVSAGLLINSFARLTGVDPGFRRDRVVRMKVSLPGSVYRTAGARIRFHRTLIDQVRALPGVRTAGVINRFPLHDGNVTTSVVVDGDPPPAPGTAPSADFRVAGVDYFKTMGISVLAGREFSSADNNDSTAIPAVVVNQTAAAILFHSPNPVGRRVTLGGSGPLMTVIGVVRDVHDASLREPPRAQIFLSALQAPQSTMSIVIHHDGAAGPVVTSVRRIVASLDKSVPMFDVQTIGDVLDKASVSDQFTMLLLSGFSFLALLLAALGTYGVMAYGVSERTREIGVRMALGARASDVLRMVLREGAALFAIAVPIALAGVWATTRALQSLLFGVEPTDPATVLISVLALAGATGIACYVPARRAAAVDPTTAIRAADGL